MEERNCYVYEDIRMDNWTCCYVGMGSKNEENGYNRLEKAERNDHHDNIMNSYGIARVIIRDNLTRKEANALEEARIYYYVFVLGYTINIKGYRKGKKNDSHLTNMTWGGDGVKGCKHSEETKKRLSEVKKGEKNPMYGVHRYGERNPMYGRTGEKHPMYGVHRYGEKNPFFEKHHTEENKKILSKTIKEFWVNMTEEERKDFNKKRSKAQCIPVIGVNIKTGEVLELNSAKQGKEFGFNPGAITQCCKNNYAKQGNVYKGYKWYYKSDYEKLSKEETIETNLNLSLISNINISI